MDLAGKIGREQVTLRSQDHWLMLLQIFKERLKPIIHENPGNYTSTLNALQTNFCH